MRKIEPNDIITLTTIAGEYRYRVLSTRIVSPDDVTVLDPGETEILTLRHLLPVLFCWPRAGQVRRAGRTGPLKGRAVGPVPVDSVQQLFDAALHNYDVG